MIDVNQIHIGGPAEKILSKTIQIQVCRQIQIGDRSVIQAEAFWTTSRILFTQPPDHFQPALLSLLIHEIPYFDTMDLGGKFPGVHHFLRSVDR